MSDINFKAIDVETANWSYASICQIGIVRVVDGQVEDTWQTWINPEEVIFEDNIQLCGWTEKDLKDIEDGPSLPELYNELCCRLGNQTLVSHTHFDRVALRQACDKYGLAHIQVDWLDSAKIVRRAWPEQFARKGYGLANVCNALKIAPFRNHDALEDALACARIVIKACEVTGLDVPRWHQRVKYGIYQTQSKYRPRSKRYMPLPEANQEGPLLGECIVFTGSLSITRSKAMSMAADLGASVQRGVTKDTTMLVVGLQASRKIKGSKSSKHRKAEKLKAAGQDIHIISESEFEELYKISKKFAHKN